MNYSRFIKFGSGEQASPLPKSGNMPIEQGGVLTTTESGSPKLPDAPGVKPKANGMKSLFSNPLVLVVAAIVVVFLILRS